MGRFVWSGHYEHHNKELDKIRPASTSFYCIKVKSDVHLCRMVRCEYFKTCREKLA